VNGIEHSEERLEELRQQEEKLLHHIGELSAKISKVRATFGKRLGERIVAELADLRMERAQFEVAITHDDDPDGCYVNGRRLAFDATGIDRVEFLMSANLGEPLRPLVKVASGGEAARIMLALKRVLTQADQTPTLIFDEIDQGIGGRVGSVVGEKLWSLSTNHQVMVVTHLPQLAGYADKHYRVGKVVQANRTMTQVIPLEDDPERIAELSDMLGARGESGTQTAAEILQQARDFKRQVKTT
jgi:DNA repair protein RecN (Recombination protein N)